MCSSLFTRPRMDIICAAFPFAFSIDHACLYFQGFLLHSFTCSSFERNVGFAGWFRGGCSRALLFMTDGGFRATTTRITSHSFPCFCAVLSPITKPTKSLDSPSQHTSVDSRLCEISYHKLHRRFSCLCFRVAIVWICACTPLT
jgi:hypothetical protein